MKLVVAVVQDQDSGRLVDALLGAGFRATKLASTGGFLKEGNTTMLVGVEDDKVDQVVETIRTACKSRTQLVTPLTSVGRGASSYIPHPVEVPIGGATIFVIPIEKFEKV